MARHNNDDKLLQEMFARLEQCAPPPSEALADRIIVKARSVKARKPVSLRGIFLRAKTWLADNPLGYAPAAAMAMGLAIGFFALNDTRFDYGDIIYSDNVGDAAYVDYLENEEAFL